MAGTYYPSLETVKEAELDFEETHALQEDKKFESPKKGKTRSISKKHTDKVAVKSNPEWSRQASRECRARKKLRYQYLEDLISETEKANLALWREFDTLKIWAKELDEGRLPENLVRYRTSCVEQKLSSPFTLQQHHHSQVPQQKQHPATLGSQFFQPPNPTLLSGGGICMPPTSGTSGAGLGLAGL